MRPVLSFLFVASAFLLPASCFGWSWSCGDCGSLYVTGECGAAWIASPTENSDHYDSCGEISSSNRGQFAWGVQGGYQHPICGGPLWLGLEGGYNDNGYSDVTFVSGNRYRIRSTDGHVMLLANYFFWCSLHAYTKIGVARARQTYSINRTVDELEVAPSSEKSCYVPALVLGVGFQPSSCFDLFVHYRGIFRRDQDRTGDAFRLTEGVPGEPGTRLRDVSTVNSVYGGLSFLF